MVEPRDAIPDRQDSNAAGAAREAEDADLGVGDPATALPYEGRIPVASGGLRRQAARGTIINAGFNVSLASLSFVQRIAIAAFLTPAELGVWGIVLITLLTLLFIKNAGISEKFVQQSEADQEVAFQKAFTLEVFLTGAFLLLLGATLPAFAAAYGQPQIIVPGLVLSLTVIGSNLQAPTWIFYRQMDFARQRKLEVIDPCTTFVVTMGLAIAGAGYWSLVLGAVVGSWAGGLIALRASPYRLRLRFDRKTAREYFDFSWPLVTSRLSAIVIPQGSVLIATRSVGIGGAGAITLAASISAFTDGVDAIVTQTIYPAICAVRDRADLLLESFVKSNRLALMWGMPFGLGLALFASDLVDFVIGEKWRSAVIVLQAFGVIAAAHQLGFNWTAYLRALNQTRPMATVTVFSVATFALVTAPLLILDGLRGYALGMLIMATVTLIARTYYLARLFSGFRMVWHTARAVAPSVPAVAAILGMRAIEHGDRTPGIAIAELVVYAVITIVATIFFERALLREVLGYLRKPPDARAGGGWLRPAADGGESQAG
jgi:polysaccharide transporter, PST family